MELEDFDLIFFLTVYLILGKAHSETPPKLWSPEVKGLHPC